MSEPKRLCAFYSRGPHYLSVLKYLRRQYPDADITAMAPAGYAPPDAAKALVNQFVEMERTAYSLREVGACWRLLRQIRSGRYDLFAVMFNSPKLRMLSALSRAKTRICLTAEGRRIDIQTSPLTVLVEESLSLIRGHLTFGVLWLIVHLTSARPRLQMRRIARERHKRGQ